MTQEAKTETTCYADEMLEIEGLVFKACRDAGLSVSYEYRPGDPWRAYLVETKGGIVIALHEDYIIRDNAYLAKMIEAAIDL